LGWIGGQFRLKGPDDWVPLWPDRPAAIEKEVYYG